MNKAITLVKSPFSPDIDTAFGFAFKLHAPYSSEMVTIMVDGSITDYQENADQEGIQVRQLTFIQHTDQTKFFELNFTNQNVYSLTEDGKTISVKLMKINPQGATGDGFFSCELYVYDDTI